MLQKDKVSEGLSQRNTKAHAGLYVWLLGSPATPAGFKAEANQTASASDKARTRAGRAAHGSMACDNATPNDPPMSAVVAGVT